METYYLAVDGKEFYLGKKFAHQGEYFACIGSKDEAKRYKSKKVLQKLIDNGNIPWTGGRVWEIVEVKE